MSTVKKPYSFVPYACIYIDAQWQDFKTAILQSLSCHDKSDEVTNQLRKLWMTSMDTNFIFPCLSVRSGFDLYLQIKNFPPGSEIIMSAINIPSMAHIIRHHRLRIVPLDVSIETVAPKVELLESLITPKTVAILIAHLYGKRCCLDPIIQVAKKNKVAVIEDCAESFDGLDNLSHPETNLALFSFGVIKYFTSFGGAVAVVKDRSDYTEMMKLHSTYPVQSRHAYLKKVLKYCAVYFILESKRFMQMSISVFNYAGIDYQNFAVKLIRGFPDRLIENIRYQPSVPLLSMMLHRHSHIESDELQLQRMKGKYVESQLPPELETVGTRAEINNYWLFPILVENPDTYIATIKALGIDAYRGATQLNLIEPDPVDTGNQDISEEERKDLQRKNLFYYPHEAKYLIDHVVYLPINKRVPFPVLDHIIKMAKTALRLNHQTKIHTLTPSIQSKL
ncbi:hypothetical protein SNE40_023093 [Patella caerulea]|uniref:DegT/DnrJ/EryC1/StrS aminotransferase family protein n=1 Tax=Patella caerulea TaxID=87958 RepID=A0AAN8FXQ1_PATCE